MAQENVQLHESQVNLSEGHSASETTKEQLSTPMKCPNCDYASTNKHYLRQHIDLVHATERPFKCPFCDYAGKRSHSLKEHLIVHSDDRPYKCAHCNAKFRKKGHLTNHYRMHSESKTPAECPLCKGDTVTFSSLDELSVHLRKAHADRRDTAVFWCNRCTYATTVKGNLHIHEMAHTDYRHVVLMKPKLPPSANIILKCSDCGFETSQRKELENHVVEKHFDGDRSLLSTNRVNPVSQAHDVVSGGGASMANPGTTPKYKCTDCGYISLSQKELVNHAIAHQLSSVTHNLQSKGISVTNISEASIESKSVVQPQSSGEGAYVCDICRYICDTQRTLKAHMWKHLGHKKLEYPTFNNGPLSVYDDTPLAAKNFVPQMQTESQQSHTANSKIRLVTVKPNHQTVLRNNVLQNAQYVRITEMTTSQPMPPAKKVIVEKVRQSSDTEPQDHSLAFRPQYEAEPSTTDDAFPNTNVAGVSSSFEDRSATATPADASNGTESLEDSNANVALLKIDSNNYSANEKTAATLLSLLRQGPNINPACPPSGYYTDVRNGISLPVQQLVEGRDIAVGIPLPVQQLMEERDSAVVGDVAGEEVVGTHEADNVSYDSGQASDCRSVGKPKAGICSSLLAVIEQLRERQADEASHHLGSRSKGRRKRKRVSDKELDELEVIPSSFLNDNHDVGNGENSTMYTCKACDYCTSSTKEMQQHISMAHADQSTDIDVLPGDFPSILEDDVDISAPDGVVYRCKLCHYRSSSHLMKQHMKIHKIKKPHECSLCDFVATSTSALQDHMIQHCKMRQFQCKLCSVVFNYKSQLRAHTRVHEDGQAFYCDHCEYVTSYIDSFRKHVSTHSEAVMSFTCIACRQVFTELVELQTHMKESCDEVRKLHKTNPLLGSWANAGHKSTDSVSRTLKCDQCEFVALSICSLKSHRKRHINDKKYIQQPLEQYKCNLCGYVCHHMPSLKSHMWRHANDTDFSYSFCDLLDDSVPAADKKGKPLITLRCCQCGYETLQKHELDKHMKTHWDIIRKTFNVGSNSVSATQNK